MPDPAAVIVEIEQASDAAVLAVTQVLRTRSAAHAAERAALAEKLAAAEARVGELEAELAALKPPAPPPAE